MLHVNLGMFATLTHQLMVNHCFHNNMISSFCSSLHFCFSFLLLLFVTNVYSLYFNFPHITPNLPCNCILFANNSGFANGEIQLTQSSYGYSVSNSVGRASYSHPVTLWNRVTNEVTDFTTHFSFIITKSLNSTYYGDGLTFFLAPFDDSTGYAPPSSDGGQLGLVNRDNGTAQYQGTYSFVAVEFDTHQDPWDPSDAHVGIDINSVNSSATTPWNGLKNMTTAAFVQIAYDSSTQTLSVSLADDSLSMNSTISYPINLRDFLPEKVRVGFTASTGSYSELHSILSWEFNSTLGDNVVRPPTDNFLPMPPSPTEKRRGVSKMAIVGGLLGVIGVLTIVLGSVGLMWCQRILRDRSRNENHFAVDDEFEMGNGPRRFTYDELSCATNNFAEEGKLGEGGFGCVYIGFLTGPSREIAVKKVSRRSRQGIKEYMSEVKIISRLRHKNLVQLLGWCHEQGELLLVYEFMPNGSLYSHLYPVKKKAVMLWTVRFKIVQGLASALFYLHEGWEQCVLHRDIKPSNIMLDSDFNTKLGDFGLARLVDHNRTSQTTLLAGTLAYLSPEVIGTGKASRKSDLYSFGVVVLELGCGRPPVDPEEEPSKVTLVEWVWDLYGKGRLLEAADKRLAAKFEAQQFECLMVVGLWCCHPDYTHRPSVRQVLNVLNMESPLPKLPSTMPVLVYISAAPSYATSSSSTRSLPQSVH